MTKNISTLVVMVSLAACSGSRSVPMTVQSDPLGAHVTHQIQSKRDGRTGDWIYLGTTPLDIRREISNKQLKNSQAFRLRVIKDGFSDQSRDWNGKEIRAEIDEKGHLFWNPKLVPNN